MAYKSQGASNQSKTDKTHVQFCYIIFQDEDDSGLVLNVYHALAWNKAKIAS